MISGSESGSGVHSPRSHFTTALSDTPRICAAFSRESLPRAFRSSLPKFFIDWKTCTMGNGWQDWRRQNRFGSQKKAARWLLEFRSRAASLASELRRRLCSQVVKLRIRHAVNPFEQLVSRAGRSRETAVKLPRRPDVLRPHGSERLLAVPRIVHEEKDHGSVHRRRATFMPSRIPVAAAKTYCAFSMSI